MSGPDNLQPVPRAARLDARTVRLARLALVAFAAAVVGLLYLLSAGFRSETNRALGILGRETSQA